MKVSFDGKWYDVDSEEHLLRDAIAQRTRRVIEKSINDSIAVPGRYSMDHVRGSLQALMEGVTLIAVKLGATAGMHHAYSQPVDYELMDTYAHVINRIVGLNYTPPEQVNTQESDSGTSEEDAG